MHARDSLSLSVTLSLALSTDDATFDIYERAVPPVQSGQSGTGLVMNDPLGDYRIILSALRRFSTATNSSFCSKIISSHNQLTCNKKKKNISTRAIIDCQPASQLASSVLIKVYSGVTSHGKDTLTSFIF